jgi:hypothetical protein
MIATIAGSGPSGYLQGGVGGDGGLATSALLNEPSDVARDGSGNLYICDFNGRIRKVSASTGMITTIAGTGVLGYSGDGGPATSAMLGLQVNIALDSRGNIYVADQLNNRVRKISGATGIITTIAGTGALTDSGDGGPAVNAAVRWPAGITLDSAGNLYFTNYLDRVRRITAATGVISTVAGQSGNSFDGGGGDNGPALAAHFYDPTSTAVDRLAGVYKIRLAS